MLTTHKTPFFLYIHHITDLEEIHQYLYVILPGSYKWIFGNGYAMADPPINPCLANPLPEMLIPLGRPWQRRGGKQKSFYRIFQLVLNSWNKWEWRGRPWYFQTGSSAAIRSHLQWYMRCRLCSVDGSWSWVQTDGPCEVNKCINSVKLALGVGWKPTHCV